MNEQLVLLDAYGLSESAVARLKRIAPGIEIVRGQRGEADYTRALAMAQIIVGWPAVEDLAAAARLRWLQLPSAGADSYIGRVREGVTLTCSRGVFGVPIAEHVLAMMLALACRLPEMIRSQASGQWQRPGTRVELAGSTCLIVGMGDIGTELARRTHALGMRTLAIKRTAADRPGFVEELGTLGDLDRLLPSADHVVLCLPGTEHTRHLFDGTRLGRMKAGACLYNVGRGRVVDEAAMVELLRTGHLAGAGLDVFETEPLPPGSPLWKMPNVIITPHCSGHTPHHAERFVALLERNLRHYLAGEAMENAVSSQWGY